MSMEEKVLTLADIGVATLNIGYNEDRSKAVIEIIRVDKDRETLSKLETLKDNFKFRPRGQKSLYEIESIETFEHFYRLFCTRVEERDEPGELGEQGTTSGIPLFSDVVDVLNVKHECGSTMTYVTAARTDKTFAFLTKWDGTPPPREFLCSLRKDDTNVFKLINVCIDFSGVTFEFSYYGNVIPNDSVSFSVPTLAVARGTKPLQPGMLTYTDTADAGSKDEIVCTKQKTLSEALLEMYPAVKSTLEREMNLIQKCKIHSDLFERKEDPKFPQMRRARLNKPKSI